MLLTGGLSRPDSWALTRRASRMCLWNSSCRYALSAFSSKELMVVVAYKTNIKIKSSVNQYLSKSLNTTNINAIHYKLFLVKFIMIVKWQVTYNKLFKTFKSQDSSIIQFMNYKKWVLGCFIKNFLPLNSMMKLNWESALHAIFCYIWR